MKKGGKELLYNSKQNGDKFESYAGGLILRLKKDIALVGDIVIEFKDTKAVGHNLLISYTFNTTFVNTNA